MPAHPSSIILIGYRATGKSTMGTRLAQALGFSFIDTDQAIEQQEGQCIRDIVQQHNWDYFRQKEKETLLKFSTEKNHVIATGGGAVLHQDIWPEIKQNNLVIWLQADIETICTRLANDTISESQRPSLTGADIQQEVADVLTARTPLYKKSSNLTLDAAQTVEDNISSVLHYLEQSSSA
jgi:shikimate kinase